MYSAAFIFEPGEYDDEFHRLNELIDDAARTTDGFIGTESWQSADGKIRNATYYWRTLEALQEFSHHARHLEAKQQYRKWYKGYRRRTHCSPYSEFTLAEQTAFAWADWPEGSKLTCRQAGRRRARRSTPCCLMLFKSSSGRSRY